MLDNGIDKLAPEIITKIRDQDTDGMCVFGTEKLGIPVWGISKLLNCLFYKDTIFFPYFLWFIYLEIVAVDRPVARAISLIVTFM